MTYDQIITQLAQEKHNLYYGGADDCRVSLGILPNILGKSEKEMQADIDAKFKTLPVPGLKSSG